MAGLLAVVLAGVLLPALGARSATAGHLWESESNGSAATADKLPLGTTVHGSTYIDSYEDEDYYALDLPSAGRLRLNLTFPSGLGTDSAYEVAVLNENGEALYDEDVAAADHDGKHLAALATYAPAGRIYVYIRGRDDWNTWGKSYALSVDRLLSATPTPTISGKVAVGGTVSAHPGTWGPGKVALKYQWTRNGKAIRNATSQRYTLVRADVGTALAVRVTGTKATYASTTRTSAAKRVPLLKLTSTPTPKVTGTPKVGKTLTAHAGRWAPAPVTVKYQWLRNGKPIHKATSATYKLTAGDRHKKIAVRVSGHRHWFATVTRTSRSVTIH